MTPGNLVALATAADGDQVVAWRWYDAVILGQSSDLVRLWEPAHGTVEARPRRPAAPWQPGTRAYLSAGLPGADWWVAGAAVSAAEDADLDVDEVERFYTDHDLWKQLS